MNKEYDCTQDVHDHMFLVRLHMQSMYNYLYVRSITHDRSKLKRPEKAIFDRFTPKLKTAVFGSNEYEKSLKSMGPALEHHYANNSHHPEHYPDGVAGMDLFDILEMLADWKAASVASPNGSMLESMEIGIERFKIEPGLAKILMKTVTQLGFLLDED